MYSALVVPRGRGRLLRYMLGCIAGLLFLQCFLSLLSSRRALPTSFFQFDSSAAASPRLVLGLANGTARPAPGPGGGPRDPLLLRVMLDPGSKPKSTPAANVTAAPAVSNVTGAGGGTSSSERPSAATTPVTVTAADGRQLCPPVPLKLGKGLVYRRGDLITSVSWDLRLPKAVNGSATLTRGGCVLSLR